MWGGFKWGAAIVLLALIAGTGHSVAATTLEVTLVNLTSPVSIGDQVTLTIKTAPGAECSGTIRYRSYQPVNLGVRTAGGDGTATWRWRAGDDPGSRTITVECRLGDQRGQLLIRSEVR